MAKRKVNYIHNPYVQQLTAQEKTRLIDNLKKKLSADPVWLKRAILALQARLKIWESTHDDTPDELGWSIIDCPLFEIICTELEKTDASKEDFGVLDSEVVETLKRVALQDKYLEQYLDIALANIKTLNA